MQSVSRLPVSGVAVGGATALGWWLTEVEDDGRGPVVAGPFPTRQEVGWTAAEHAPGTVETVYGVCRPDGRVKRRPSPQEWAWLAHLGEQMGRLPAEWEAVVDDGGPPRRRAAPPAGTRLPKIGAPATRALTAAGLTTLEAVAAVPEHELAALHGVGPIALANLREALAEHRLARRD